MKVLIFIMLYWFEISFTAEYYVLDKGSFVEMNIWEYFTPNGTISYFVLPSVCNSRQVFKLFCEWHNIFNYSFYAQFILSYFIAFSDIIYLVFMRFLGI